MGRPVRVPGPVYNRIESEAEREDISHGAVVRDWMEKAQTLEEMEGRR